MRDAMTCDRPTCVGRMLEPTDYPDETFEECAAVHGWTYEETGHTCPACVVGQGPVAEFGDCQICGGTTVDLARGAVCHYCGHVRPHTEEA